MSDAAPDNGNGRITNADRMARIETKLDAIAEKLDCMNNHEPRITRLETRTDMLASGNALLTLIASAIAGWIGANR